MELAAQDARPVPREASRKQVSSKGTGAMAKPADAVLTTRAVSLILDKRAKIPGKSSSRSFISFHCLSSLDLAPTGMTESSAADFISLNSFLLDVSDHD